MNKSTGNIEQLVMAIPKIELHLHLEGAIPLETLLSLIQRKGSEPSIKTVEDLREKLVYKDFRHFLSIWAWKNTFITEEEDFEEIVYQVLADLSRQNVRYVEAFYSPMDFRRWGLSARLITDCLIRGKERAYRDFGIRSELILDLVRDYGPELGIELLTELTSYVGKGIIGIGIGGSEQEYPAELFSSLYKEAKERGFRLTAHAGEAAGAGSIRAAVEKLHVERIGHGVRANEDAVLISLLRELQIPLEMCVTSNIETGVCRSVKEHPIREYFEQGLMVTVNSDDPTMFNTSTTQEYLLLIQELGFSLNDLKRLSMNGISASFMPDSAKETMKSQFEIEWGQLLKTYDALR